MDDVEVIGSIFTVEVVVDKNNVEVIGSIFTVEVIADMDNVEVLVNNTIAIEESI